jgi:hypothetical protein
MAYAYCPKCQKSFRYAASAVGGPSWLKDVARSLGRGESAVLLCYRCWVVPEEGDQVEVLETSDDANRPRRGDIGVVVAVKDIEDGNRVFVVESRAEGNTVLWRQLFSSSQITASPTLATGTLRLNLGNSDS